MDNKNSVVGLNAILYKFNAGKDYAVPHTLELMFHKPDFGPYALLRISPETLYTNEGGRIKLTKDLASYQQIFRDTQNEVNAEFQRIGIPTKTTKMKYALASGTHTVSYIDFERQPSLQELVDLENGLNQAFQDLIVKRLY